MRFITLPNPQSLLRKLYSTFPNPNPRIPRWLPMSRQICTPSHLSQFLSLSIIAGFFAPSHLPFFNSLLHSLSRFKSPNLPISLFNSIRRNGIFPDNYTLISVLKAVSSLLSLKKGEEIHSLTVKLGFESDTFVLNSLIHMYSLCHSIKSARRVFDSASDSILDVVSWNSMISGYLKCNLCEEALWVFGKMVAKSVRMDGFTPVSALTACGRIGALGFGRKIHSLVVVNGFELDIYLGSSLVSMYAKCGDFGDAWKLFDRIPHRNAVCWTSMISGYSQAGKFRESIELFREMQVVGVKPDAATVAIVVSCCGQVGALNQGRYVHAYCDANGIGTDLVVKNALIDLYSKCGDVDKALKLFLSLVRPDVFSWTAMISGLAMNGYSREALKFFSRMEASGEVLPNEVTFLGVLSACSHGGLVEEGYYYFDCLSRFYKITPKIEHYGCMVDLLGRAKLLAEAERFIKEMPIEPDVVIWRSLLFACRANGDVELAEFAAKKIVELEPRKCGGPVLLSNVYAVASRWSKVNHVRRVMSDCSIQKQPGCSFIEVNGVVHEFFAGDTSHHRTDDVHQVLRGISKVLLSEPCTADYSGYFGEATE